MTENLLPDEEWAKDEAVMLQVNMALLPLYDFFENYNEKPVKVLLKPLEKWRGCLQKDTVLPQKLRDELSDFLDREESVIRYHALLYCEVDFDDLFIYLSRAGNKIKRVNKNAAGSAKSRAYIFSGCISLINNPEDRDFWISKHLINDEAQFWRSERLELLRTLSHENRKCLNKPLGDAFTRKGGQKNWKIVREVIYNLYYILKPYYPSTHRVSTSRRKGIPENKKADYPQALFKAIADLLKDAFPKELHDLDAVNVKSKIQNIIKPLSSQPDAAAFGDLFFDNEPLTLYISCSKCERKKNSQGAKKIKGGYVCRECQSEG